MAFLRDTRPSQAPHDFSQQLVADQLISPDQLRIAALEAQRHDTPLETSLVKLGFISESVLATVLAQADGVEHLTLPQVVLDPQLTGQISKSQVLRYQILPLSLQEGTLRLGMVHPYDIQALDRASHLFPHVTSIKPLLISQSDFLEAVDRSYGYEMSIHGLLAEIESNTTRLDPGETYQNPTVRLIDALLLDAVKAGASDIHFEPEGAYMRIRYRLDGLLHQIRTLHSSYWPAMCVRLKVMSQMNISESRRPQDGRFSLHVGPREVDVRVSTHPTVGGENIVLRILDKSRSLLPLTQLGYSPSALVNIEKALERPEGLVILTGPTGAGKTTSLYSMISVLSTLEINIMTLEEPVEYRLPLVRQTHIQETLSYADGIKSILRQDPDVILIGEIRDEDTAQMALRAAMTGHRVFTTLHTQDALGVIHRLQELGIGPPLLAGNLTAIIAQRLIRRLCPHCKQQSPLNAEEALLLGSKPAQLICKPQGCARCHHTGFQGRTAIAEVINFNTQLSDLILEKHPRAALLLALQEQGHKTLEHEARQRIISGDTSLCEIKRCVHLRPPS